MSKELSEQDTLYRYLHGCCGLNLYAGYKNITMDFDWKHIFKRKNIFYHYIVYD